ncbi:MAG: hypothetical protein ABI765_05555 [Gemmatimonadota bacterium]
MATGPKGAAWSPDEGDSWFAMDSTVHYCWPVTLAYPDAGWLMGEGRILKASFNDCHWDWH